jgi:ketosteroid isomerase-like protein
MSVITLFVVALGMLMIPFGVSAQEEGMNPADVVEAIYAAVGEKDIDAAVALLADDAVLTLVPPPAGLDGTFIGKAEIGGWYKTLAEGNGRFEITNVSVAGNTASMKLAFYDDLFEELGVAPAEFDGVAVVQDGLVKSLNWVFTPQFAAKMGAAMAQQAVKAAAARYMEELWNQGDLAVADEILADDFVSHNFPAGDREALKGAVTGFRAENPNAYFAYDDPLVTEDRVFIINTMMVRPEGAAADVEGEPAGGPMVLVLGVKDGKFTDRWLFVSPPE